MILFLPFFHSIIFTILQYQFITFFIILNKNQIYIYHYFHNSHKFLHHHTYKNIKSNDTKIRKISSNFKLISALSSFSYLLWIGLPRKEEKEEKSRSNLTTKNPWQWYTTKPKVAHTSRLPPRRLTETSPFETNT